MQQRVYKSKVRTPARQFFEDLETTQEDERRAAEKRLNAVLRAATTVLARIDREAS